MAASKKKNIEELSFEEAEARLTQIVAQLEKGEEPLDSMLKLYEEGTALLRRANELLTDAEERVKIVGENGQKPLD